VEEGRKNKPKRKHAALRAVIFSILGLWALVIIALQVLLNSKVITRVVDKVASEYIDGSIEFSRITASMFRSFPYFNVTIDSCSVTYPHDKFAAFDDSLGIDDFMMRQGRGAEADTLVHFDRFSAAIDYVSLFFGKYHIRQAELSRPKIFAHQYDSLNANWNIIKLAAKDDADTSSHPLPPITISHVRLSGRPLIVYTNPSDTLFGTIVLKNLNLDGRLTNEKGRKNDISFSLDSLFFSGRLPADTVAFALDQMRIKNHREHSDVEMHSKALLALHSAGRMEIPIDFDGHVSLDLARKVIDMPKLAASIAGIDIKGNLLLRMSGENPYLKTDLSVDKEKISDIASTFKDNFPFLGKVSTDATLSLDAHCDGEYADGVFPNMSVRLQVPRSEIAYEGIEGKGAIDLDVTLKTVDGKLLADVPDICLLIKGLEMNLSGSSEDLLAQDPSITLDSDVKVDLDSLSYLIPDSLGIMMSGSFAGNISGTTRLSQLDIYNFSDCGLTGDLKSSGLRLSMPRDTLFAYLGPTTISIGKEIEHHHLSEDGDHSHEAGQHDAASLSAQIDSLYATYGSSMFIRGRGVTLLAHNTEDSIKSNPGKHPLHGHLEISRIGLLSADSVFVGVKNANNIFVYKPELSDGKEVPYLNLNCSYDGAALRSGVDRYSVSGIKLTAAAHPDEGRELSRRQKLDSLQKLYPLVQRDSLFRYVYRRLRAGRPVPDYLSEEDFRKKDIDIHLSEAMAKYIRNWDIKAEFSIQEGTIITPYYPLDNKISGFSGSFTNDRLELSNLSAQSGQSQLSVNGSLSGLRRALSGRGRSVLNLDLNVNGGLIDVDEIVMALNAGSKFEKPEDIPTLDESVGDNEYLKNVKEKAAVDSVIERSTLILPSNLNAKVNIQADKVVYSDLETSYLTSNIEMKQRCLQLTNTMMMTNMGEAYLEGFYSTKTKKDLKAGFDLTLSNITAEKVIHLFPAVDSIVPMLKAFNGLLDCEMAATATIDDKMNILLPTLNGIIKIDGKNLLLEGGKEIDKLRKTLRFKDRDTSIIADMSIRGIIKDNQLEIFPFMLNVDRYSLALSGLQKFDQTFKYHFSALKSPIPFRFGVNLKGSFAKWGWKLGKAKYKNSNLPSFDDQVDELRLTLVNSIHNIFKSGVDQAMLRTEQSQEAIEQKKTQLDYSSDALTDSLSTSEKGIMKTLEKIASGTVVSEKEE
jgi:hypothetical protein